MKPEPQFNFWRLWPLLILITIACFLFGCTFSRKMEKEKASTTVKHVASNTKTTVVYGYPPNSAVPMTFDTTPKKKPTILQRIFGKKAVVKNSFTTPNGLPAELSTPHNGLIPISATVVTNYSSESRSTTSFWSKLTQKFKANTYYLVFGILAIVLVAGIIYFKFIL